MSNKVFIIGNGFDNLFLGFHHVYKAYRYADDQLWIQLARAIEIADGIKRGGRVAHGKYQRASDKAL